MARVRYLAVVLTVELVGALTSILTPEGSAMIVCFCTQLLPKCCGVLLDPTTYILCLCQETSSGSLESTGYFVGAAG